MTTWTSDELNTIGTAEELDLAPLRRNGTLRTPVTIWVVRLGDDLYVRSYRGHGGSWFRAAQVRHEGRLRGRRRRDAVVVMAQTEHIPPFTGTCSRYSSPSSHMREKGAQD
jgi:hypothetical protein